MIFIRDNDVKNITGKRNPIEDELTGILIGGTINFVKITFDPVKRQTALDQRGLNFADASIVFAGATITAQDTRRDYGEVRFQTIGFLADRMVMVVWTPRGERGMLSR